MHHVLANAISPRSHMAGPPLAAGAMQIVCLEDKYLTGCDIALFSYIDRARAPRWISLLLLLPWLSSWWGRRGSFQFCCKSVGPSMCFVWFHYACQGSHAVFLYHIPACIPPPTMKKLTKQISMDMRPACLTRVGQDSGQ